MQNVTLDLLDVLALIGVSQCVYVLVYILFRGGFSLKSFLPILYFAVLGIALAFEFADSVIADLFKAWPYAEWMAWYIGPPLSFLLVLQIARITRLPSWKAYLVLLLIPAALLISYTYTRTLEGCAGLTFCPAREDWLKVTGIIAGSISLLAVWFNRSIMENILAYKMGRERYWAIIALILLNSAFLLLALLSFSPDFTVGQHDFARVIVGLGLAYVVGASLFRIYPQALRLKETQETEEQDTLNDEELDIALKVERLLALDKVYQEPAYSRSDLARECGVSEAQISRIINLHFNKSFPQIMNEHRVEDAKRLLQQTQAPIATIAQEVGFNSLATFNRVFKDIAGQPPSRIRDAA